MDMAAEAVAGVEEEEEDIAAEAVAGKEAEAAVGKVVAEAEVVGKGTVVAAEVVVVAAVGKEAARAVARNSAVVRVVAGKVEVDKVAAASKPAVGRAAVMHGRAAADHKAPARAAASQAEANTLVDRKVAERKAAGPKARRNIRPVASQAPVHPAAINAAAASKAISTEASPAIITATTAAVRTAQTALAVTATDPRAWQVAPVRTATPAVRLAGTPVVPEAAITAASPATIMVIITAVGIRSRMGTGHRIMAVGITATGMAIGAILGASARPAGIGAAAGALALVGDSAPALRSASRSARRGLGVITPTTILIGLRRLPCRCISIIRSRSSWRRR